MSKPIIKIHNVQSDEIIEREMNDEEFAAYLVQQEANAKAQAEADAKAEAKAALLAKLGITEDEAQLLLS